MGIYKQHDGKVWWMSFTYRGRQIRKSTGTRNRKLAEEIYCKTKTRLVEGTYLDVPKTRDRPFSELLDRYLAEVTPGKKPSTQMDDRGHVRQLTGIFGHLFPDEITPDLVCKYRVERRKTIGACRMNRVLSFMSAVFNQAIKVWGWHKGENPIARIPREKESQRSRYFAEDEFAAIYGCLADWVKPIVLFARNTGLRLSNIVNLRWSQVNMKSRLVVFEAGEMKNSKSLGVPLNETAFTILSDRQRERRSEFVFCKGNGASYSTWGVGAAFKKACVKAGFPNDRFHDLRHDFCSKLVQAGVDLYTVKELVGHKDITTTQRYAHLSPERLRSAVSVLDYHKTIIVEGKDSAGDSASH